MQRYENNVLASNGECVQITPYADVYVYETGTVTLAAIYQTNEKAPLVNPFQSDYLGNFFFYAEDGRYDIRVVAAGRPEQWSRDVLLEDIDALGAVTQDEIAVKEGFIDEPADAAPIPSVGQPNGLGSLNAQAKAISANLGQIRGLIDEFSDGSDVAKGASLVMFLAEEGATAISVAKTLRERAGVHHYVKLPDADHTAAFERALAAAKVVYFDATYGPFTLSGTVMLPSNRLIEFIGSPELSVIVDGNERGIWWPAGTENTWVRGGASISAVTNSAGTDGSYNGVFTMGQFYYTSAPAAIRKCGVVGEITINCVGSANSKPVSVYGYTEDCTFEGITATGRTNYAFSAHWASDGDVGVLPTLTWHPNRLTFRKCRAIDDPDNPGLTLRGFTTSACGKVVFEDCESRDLPTLGFNLFVGDYGYTYADNLSQDEAYQMFLVRCEHSGNATGLSADAQSSGLNGSAIWTGCDHNAQINLEGGLRIRIGQSATSTVGAAFSMLESVVGRLEILEQGTNNGTAPLTVFGCKNVRLDGQLLARFGTLIRASGQVRIDTDLTTPLPEPDLARYGISAAATSSSATTSGDVAIGGQTITLADNTLVTGAGGFVRFNDGVSDYEIELLSSTYSSGVQTVSMRPSPVAIPSGSTVTVVQTVKRLVVGAAKLIGYAVNARFTGSATAKVRNVEFRGTEFQRGGVFDIEFAAVDGAMVSGTVHDFCGQRTTTTSIYAVNVGANAEGVRVIGQHLKKNNQAVLYGVYLHNSSQNSYVTGWLHESLQSDATAASVYKNSAANSVIDTVNNVRAAGIAAVYP